MRSSSPIEGRSSALRRVRKLGAHEWRDLAVAAGELAVARVRLAWSDPELLLRAASPRRPSKSAETTEGWVKRVGTAVARASHRVPWRSDCLVQALAARRWLLRHGVATELVVGVRPPEGTRLDAHAWLKWGDVVVTGGDVAEFVPLSARSKR